MIIILANPAFWVIPLAVILPVLITSVPIFFLSHEESDSADDIFECGIDPFFSHQKPVYMHFFLVGILFLVFDIEVVVTIPLISNHSSPVEWKIVWFILISILILGLLLEVILGTLDWNE